MPQTGKNRVLGKDLGVASQGLENLGRLLNRDMTKKHFKDIYPGRGTGVGNGGELMIYFIMIFYNIKKQIYSVKNRVNLTIQDRGMQLFLMLKK